MSELIETFPPTEVKKQEWVWTLPEQHELIIEKYFSLALGVSEWGASLFQREGDSEDDINIALSEGAGLTLEASLVSLVSSLHESYRVLPEAVADALGKMAQEAIKTVAAELSKQRTVDL